MSMVLVPGQEVQAENYELQPSLNCMGWPYAN